MTTPLTPQQEEMVKLWDAHTAAEFATSDVDATMVTMTDDPYVNHVPTMTGGVGVENVRAFYSKWFVPAQPPDVEVEMVNRTVGSDSIVDEIHFRCTHSIEMPWLLPGVPPTGRRIEIAIAVVVGFESGRISCERIYWDQASVLVQAGLLDPTGLPVGGVEVTRKAADVRSVPSNLLIERGAAR
jgi:carboxymethylenebutenolidase